MSVELTVTLPETTYSRARRLSDLTGQPIEDIVAAMLELSLPLLPQVDVDKPVSALSDAQIDSLCDLQISPEGDQRQSELLDKQQSGHITAAEQIELQALMRVYEIGMVYKAQALAEAVKRGFG